EIEMSQLRYLVAPEFHAYGIRHSEAVHVEDSAAHAELSDILDHVDALESYGIEMLDQLAQLAYVTLPQLEPAVLQNCREPGALHYRACSRDEYPHVAARCALQCLHALARDLRVRLRFAKTLARRIERDRVASLQRLEVGEPA